MSKQKLITTKELRGKKVKDLLVLLREKQNQIMKDQMDLVNQKTKNTNLLKASRQTIARIKTVLAEKRDLEALEVETKK